MNLMEEIFEQISNPWNHLKAAIMDAYPADGSAQFDWGGATNIVMGFLNESQADQELTDAINSKLAGNSGSMEDFINTMEGIYA